MRFPGQVEMETKLQIYRAHSDLLSIGQKAVCNVVSEFCPRPWTLTLSGVHASLCSRCHIIWIRDRHVNNLGIVFQKPQCVRSEGQCVTHRLCELGGRPSLPKLPEK